jgi:hypothetical protein
VLGSRGKRRTIAYFVDGFSFELSDELFETGLISVDVDGAEQGLDVRRGRRGVAANLEKEVCSNVTHLGPKMNTV